jgi:thiol-disulfide isomerase/thioredoxin
LEHRLFRGVLKTIGIEKEKAPMTIKRRWMQTVLSGLIGLGIVIGGIAAVAHAAEKGTMVIFTAGWSASCREVLPIVRDIANTNGLTLKEVNVDDQNAPSQVSKFGLKVPTSDPPQVFLVTGNKVTLLFDGSRYSYGRGDMVRTTVLQNLQRQLGAGASQK